MARWHLLLPAQVSNDVFAAVDALARQYARAHPGTPVDRHRADALADLVLGNADVSTTVELVVPVAQEERSASESAVPDPVDHRPAARDQPEGHAACAWFVAGSVHLGRHGALLPAELSELLCRPDIRVRLARLDLDGMVTQDPRTYRPHAWLERHVRRRDGTCRFPGCHVPAARCDVDHVVRHPDGPTDRRNLICLCRTHHRFKHHGGWRPQLHPDARVTWSTPDGRCYETLPRLPEATEVDGPDEQLLHDLRRGWFPGLPAGMSLADLVRAEAALPEDPPESESCPDPPQDWQDLDGSPPPESGAVVGSALERRLSALIALAA
jgi:hypothetical protein